MPQTAAQSPEDSLEDDLKRARVLANLLDARFEVLGFKFGIDALVGLIPIAGDLASFLAGLYPLVLARRHGLGKVVKARMWMNLGIDLLGGSVPLLGDLFDAAYRANLKNLKLLEDATSRARTMRHNAPAGGRN